jgi:hypothetical protein
MSKYEYTEGKKALENFEQGMAALFRVPKAEAVLLKKKPSSSRKPKEGRQGLEGDWDAL